MGSQRLHDAKSILNPETQEEHPPNDAREQLAHLDLCHFCARKQRDALVERMHEFKRQNPDFGTNETAGATLNDLRYVQCLWKQFNLGRGKCEADADGFTQTISFDPPSGLTPAHVHILEGDIAKALADLIAIREAKERGSRDGDG